MSAIMRTSASCSSPSKLIRSTWRRKLFAQQATTRRAFHTSPAAHADGPDPAQPQENPLASRIQSALEFHRRDQRAAGPSSEALMQRLSVKSVKHTVHSFNPSMLSEADYVDLSGHTCQLNVAHRFSRIQTVIPYRYQPFTPFRPGTAGFFYYTSSPSLPEAGEIRFRITGSPMRESFALGRDLLTSNGLVWRLHLLTMVKGFDEYASIVAQLQSEGLLAHATRNSCLSLTREIKILSNTERALHSLYQPFIFDFKNRKPKCLWFLTPSSLEKVFLEDWITKHGAYALPSNGTVMLCAEPLKAADDADSRTIVLRVLRIVRPVVYPRRRTLRTTEGDGAGDKGDEEGPAAPRPPVSGSSDGLLRAYEGQLLSNSLGEALTYMAKGEGWPTTWKTTGEGTK